MVKIKNTSVHQPENMIIEVDDMKAKELMGTGMYIYEGSINKKKTNLKINIKKKNGDKSNRNSE